MKLTIDDIHFVVGPNITNQSKEDDYVPNGFRDYDLKDDFKNMKKMFERVDKQVSKEEKEERDKKRAEREARKQE